MCLPNAAIIYYILMFRRKHSFCKLAKASSNGQKTKWTQKSWGPDINTSVGTRTTSSTDVVRIRFHHLVCTYTWKRRINSLGATRHHCTINNIVHMHHTYVSSSSWWRMHPFPTIYSRLHIVVVRATFLYFSNIVEKHTIETDFVIW